MAAIKTARNRNKLLKQLDTIEVNCYSTVKRGEKPQNLKRGMAMKYRLGSLTVEAIDTYVRVTVSNIGGAEAPDMVAVTKRQCPKTEEVVALVAEMRGYWPDSATLQVCGRAAEDARNNKIELAL